MMGRFRAVILSALVVVGLANQAAAESQLHILAMGDSLMASHRISGRAISNALGKALGVKVTDRSVMGARHIYKLPITGSLGLKIARQYRKGNWDWIVMNGGGNDLWFGCGCNRCDRKMDRLISENGKSGEIPKLLNKLRKTGAKIAYVGYLRSPGVNSPIENCKDEGDELERRIGDFAQKVDGVYFVSLADLVPYGDTSFHGADMIHPSRKASSAIGRRVAQTILQAERKN